MKSKKVVRHNTTKKTSTKNTNSQKIFVIPDAQVKPHVPLNHLAAAGRYAAAKRPDKIVCIGDFFDFESLCSYDVGQMKFEGRSYVKDVEAGQKGMRLLMEPIINEQIRLQQEEGIDWEPQLHFTLGNHESRVLRAINMDRKLSGLISFKDMQLEDWGWKVHPFLKVVNLCGINFSHYHVSGVMGRPIGSARALLTKKHESCVQGHIQSRDVATAYTASGRQITGLMVGTFYQHDEDYLTPQTNRDTWRGCWMLYNCNKGEFDPVALPMNYLLEKYSK